MIREVATDRFDLPHAFAGAEGTCSCGREQADALHDAVLTEKAAFTPTIVTEKGSPDA